MTKDEALTLALEALEACIDYIAPYTHHIQGEEDADTAEEAITAIKEALAQPMQRPWVGLTDEEIKAMDAGLTSNSSFYAGALWAEAKLKEKNQ